ncbi:hypothetical protein AAVH_25994 [Aphelenchoides avenae]|nr:hypothetical protein AAVH_25994 [Aphelenchus avenae]
MYSQLMKVQCQKTCNSCGYQPPPQPPVQPPTRPNPPPAWGMCQDAWPDCPVWRANGFCNQNNYYSVQDRMRYCGVTCGLCGSYINGYLGQGNPYYGRRRR